MARGVSPDGPEHPVSSLSNPTAKVLCCRSQFFGPTGVTLKRHCSAVDPKVVAMLAEIFMLRLEAGRALKETLPSSTSQFASFNSDSQFTFKKNRLSEVVREQPTVEKLQ
jgi:hypothetical protein